MKRNRLVAIVAVSVGLHGTLLAYLALERPALAYHETSEQVFEITMVPQYLIEPEHSRPTPIRPRLVQGVQDDFSVAPLRLAPVPSAATPGPQVQTVQPVQPTDNASLGRILRSGGLGCRNQDLSGLSSEERARCLERLGAGARGAAYLKPGIAPQKQAILDAWGEKKSLQWKRDHEQITGFGHITTDGGPTMRPIPDTNPTPKGPNEIRIPF